MLMQRVEQHQVFKIKTGLYLFDGNVSITRVYESVPCARDVISVTFPS